MDTYVLGFDQIDRTSMASLGAKGANLGELSAIPGVRVPDGFCVTTEAYRAVTGSIEQFDALLEQLSRLTVDDSGLLAQLSATIRQAIEAAGVPAQVEADITRYLNRFGEENAWAVRSSATAEDLPTASFAGQQDTYLNILGRDSVLRHISRCWASLFTDRAVQYRIRNGFDHRLVALSVVVQKMVVAQASGILFTADPITSDRKVSSIDAGFGLGEALVSGLVTPDSYKVRDGQITQKKISSKKLAVQPLAGGGTGRQPIEPGRQNRQVLTDDQVVRLERLGRAVEARFGQPQDIEWCLADGEFFIVQSRPITTLYPIPQVADGHHHVYMCIGHQQMMTDAMKPFALSFFRVGFMDGAFPTADVGGRMYLDLSHDLAGPWGRIIVAKVLGGVDPVIRHALNTLTKRKDFMKGLAHGREKYFSLGAGYFTWGLIVQLIRTYRTNDPRIIPVLISRNEASVEALRREIRGLSGEELLDFCVRDLKRLKELVYDPQGMAPIYVGLYAMRWINKNARKWLGDAGVADVLSRSVPNNVTSEMGLALLDVADVVRRYPQAEEALRHAGDQSLFDDLAAVEGGEAVTGALQDYLEKYGRRCAGEIDITRPRWGERPTALVPIILSNIEKFEPGARDVIVERGRQVAARKEQDILGRLERLPRGPRKARRTRRMVSVMRNFIGYREYPKYLMMGHFWLLKQALLGEAASLVHEGVIREQEDIFYLSFEELRAVVRTHRVDEGLLAARKAQHRVDEKLTPPRVMTSEGEVFSGGYDTGGLPTGALAGIAASSGTVEGRARVVGRMEDAVLAAGDILVTAFTDPSWTPVFMSATGLVTEVGGQMTHGAVIAREYGLPAVVGVEYATSLIKDGQRIRVNGTEGYVEIL